MSNQVFPADSPRSHWVPTVIHCWFLKVLYITLVVIFSLCILSFRSLHELAEHSTSFANTLYQTLKYGLKVVGRCYHSLCVSKFSKAVQNTDAVMGKKLTFE